jgi:hypothetical protein
MTAVLGSVLLPATAYSAVRSTTHSDVTVGPVSCAPGGTCAAVGEFTDTQFHGQPFVLTGKNGQWGRATVLPGIPASADGGMDSVSCAPGECVAGGTYNDGSDGANRFHVFVTSERNGKWSRLTTLFTGKLAASGVDLSCPAAGSCAAGDGLPLFVANESKGHWDKPIQFPTKAKFGGVGVTCTSSGNCLAYFNTFVATERNGRWGKPAAIPGLAKLGTAGAAITSITCPTAGNCAAGGVYFPDSNTTEVFVASERNGRWGKATQLPGFAALNTEGGGRLAEVTCLSAGNCVAGGSYAATADFFGGADEPFVASERNGHWGKAIEVPGIPAPSSAICEPDSDSCVAGEVFAISCSRAVSTCIAGGWYDTKAINGEAALVTSYKNGHWSKVIQIPGLAFPDSSQVNSVSCTSAGICVAVGNGQGGGAAFLTFEKGGTWSQAQPIRF